MRTKEEKEVLEHFAGVVSFPHLISRPGCVAQSVAPLTQEPEVPGLKPSPATYFCFSFRSFKKGNGQLLAKVCAQSTG